MTKAPIGLTKAQAGVIPTKPAMTPEAVPRVEGFLKMIHSANIQVKAAAAGQITVFMKARALTPSALNSEPALKPSHPIHKRQAPI